MIFRLHVDYMYFRLHVHVHPLWLRETEISGHKRLFRDLAKLNGVLSIFVAPCIYCGKQVGDKLIHYITACSKYDGIREYFWTLIVSVFSVSIRLKCILTQRLWWNFYRYYTRQILQMCRYWHNKWRRSLTFRYMCKGLANSCLWSQLKGRVLLNSAIDLYSFGLHWLRYIFVACIILICIFFFSFHRFHFLHIVYRFCSVTCCYS